MTVPRDIERRLDRSIAALTRAAGGLPVLYAFLAAVTPDGYPSGGAGRSTTHSDTVLRAVVQRDEGLADLFERRIKMIHIGATELAGAIDHLQRLAPDVALEMYERHRCSGGMGLPGAMEWGEPSCLKIVGEHSRTGLCDACRMRQRRWRDRLQRGAA